MVTVQKNEEVMQLAKEIYERIDRGEAVPEDGELAATGRQLRCLLESWPW